MQKWHLLQHIDSVQNNLKFERSWNSQQSLTLPSWISPLRHKCQASRSEGREVYRVFRDSTFHLGMQVDGFTDQWLWVVEYDLLAMMVDIAKLSTQVKTLFTAMWSSVELDNAGITSFRFFSNLFLVISVRWQILEYWRGFTNTVYRVVENLRKASPSISKYCCWSKSSWTASPWWEPCPPSPVWCS